MLLLSICYCLQAFFLCAILFNLCIWEKEGTPSIQNTMMFPCHCNRREAAAIFFSFVEITTGVISKIASVNNYLKLFLHIKNPGMIGNRQYLFHQIAMLIHLYSRGTGNHLDRNFIFFLNRIQNGSKDSAASPFSSPQKGRLSF